jgi:Protein of unknown function (DUF3800)
METQMADRIKPDDDMSRRINADETRGGGGSGDDDLVVLVPGYRDYLIFGDESGTGGATHYGFGTLWLPAQRRGDLYGVVQRLCDKHGYDGEVKWNKVSRGNEPFYRDLMIEFFKRPWMMFHALIVRKAYVERSFHDGDWDLARRKHQTMLLSNKIAHFSEGFTDKRYHVRLDHIASRYGKADEVIHKVSNYELENKFGIKPITSLRAVDSKESLGIQVCDFLLGAAMAEWQGDIKADHKKRMTALLAHHLDWPDMSTDTYPTETKFNLWSFYDPAAKLPRDRKTRAVKLAYPMPAYRRRR